MCTFAANKDFFVHQTSCNTIKKCSAFSVEYPQEQDGRQLPNFESFKYKLKQHYFKNAKPSQPPTIILATDI
jgi:hypothetical protein